MRFLMRPITLAAMLLLPGSTPATNTTPSLAFDHIWIHVARDVPEAEALINAGFKIPPARPHAGLGTASTAVIFRNAYLELIWVEDPQALRQAAPDFAQALLGETGASPYGIGLRRATHRDDLSFESTSISAEFLEAGSSIEVARQPIGGAAYPPIFVVPRYMGFPEWKDQVQFVELRENTLGVRDITQVRLHGPGLSATPPAIGDLTVPEFVEFVSADDHLLELEFDGRAQDAVLDLRPTLPLIIRY